MSSVSVLKECSCCGEVRLPGEYEARPFLQASEMKLLELIGQNSVFDIEKPFVFPEVIIRAGDQEQNGFEAEYRVYEELKKSSLHMYVFYTLKTKKNEELGDFLLVSESSVIILDVKSFKLVDNPTVKDYETLQKKLSDYKRQEERVIRNIKDFMSNHGCENNVDLFLYFNLFQNTKRSQLPKETDWLPKNVLFKDDYLKVIEDKFVINSSKKVDENGEYTLRIFLAWFYGLHISYLNTNYQWDIMRPATIIKKALDEEYRRKKRKDEKMNKGVANIFLTPAQKEIVECDYPFLQIIGLPGTGKTYCLILKMVDVFLELRQLRREQENGKKELIIVFHRNENTIQWISEMFWQTIEQIEGQSNEERKKSSFEEISKLIKFIGGSDLIDIESKESFQIEKFDLETRFKVFWDDVPSEGIMYDLPRMIYNNSDGLFEIFRAIDRSNFSWCTSYSQIPTLVNFYRPISCVSVKGDKICDYSNTTYLTESLRYTGSIHYLLSKLQCYLLREDFYKMSLYPKYSCNDPRPLVVHFSPGTRVIGEKPEVICVQDFNSMKNKVQELLKTLEKKGTQRDEIAVIRTDMASHLLCKQIRNEVKTGIAPNRSEVCNDLLSALGSGDDLEIEDAHYISSEFPEEMNFSLRGMEVNHVILCFIPELNALPKEKRVALNEKIDLYLSERKRVRMGKWRQEAHSFHRIFNNFDHWQMRKTHDLIEAISRAVTSVTIVYMEDICEDLWFNHIIERYKNASPKIRPNYANRNSKQQIKNIEPLYLSKVHQLYYNGSWYNFDNIRAVWKNNCVNTAGQFYCFYSSYYLLKLQKDERAKFHRAIGRNERNKQSRSAALPCFNILFKDFCCDSDLDTDSLRLIIQMLVFGQIILFLNIILTNFSHYKKIIVTHQKSNKQAKIELDNHKIEKYLSDWMEQLKTKTVEEIAQILEKDTQFETINNHPFSFLVKTLIFITETKLFPIIPIITQDCDCHANNQAFSLLDCNSLWTRSIKVAKLDDIYKDSYSKLDTFPELDEYHLFGSNLLSDLCLEKTDKFDLSDLNLYFDDLLVEGPSVAYYIDAFELAESDYSFHKDVLGPLKYFSKVLHGFKNVSYPWFNKIKRNLVPLEGFEFLFNRSISS